MRNLLFLLIWNISSRSKRPKLIRRRGTIVGEGCEIYRDVNFGSEPYLIEIGNNVRITSGVKFCTHDGGVWTIRKTGKNREADLFGRIKVGNNVHIGWNTIIMPGVTIGDNCIVGCSSVVTKSVPDNSVVVGVPAKVIRTIDEYYEKNESKFIATSNMSAKDKRKKIQEMY